MPLDRGHMQSTIRRAKRAIANIARRRVPSVRVLSFGATEVGPQYLAFWIVTDTDKHRQQLELDYVLRQEFHEALLTVGYPASAIPSVKFEFESQETVDRDF